MKRLLRILRELFCMHDYRRERFPGFTVEDGWLVQLCADRCTKCGKVNDIREMRLNADDE